MTILTAVLAFNFLFMLGVIFVSELGVIERFDSQTVVTVYLLWMVAAVLAGIRWIQYERKEQNK